jgi:hypothetical protein
MAACAALACGAAVADTIRTVDGREIAGTVLSLDARNIAVQSAAGKSVVPLDSVAAVAFAAGRVEDVMDRKGQSVIVLKDGTVLAGLDIRIGDGLARAATESCGAVSAPLKQVSRIWRPRQSETPRDLEQQCERLRVAARDNDVLIVRGASGKWLPVPAFVESLAGGQVAFTYEGRETSLAEDVVAAIVFAGAAAEQTGTVSVCRVMGTDGTRIAAAAVMLDGDRLAVESAGLGETVLARKSVAEIRFGSARATCLSDLDPTDVEETPFFDDLFSWRKDKSASGRPLALEGITYERGIGLHARCRLVFELRGRFSRLSALAGIDGELPFGRAALSILADGKPLTDRVLLDRAEAPKAMDLDVAGVKTLTILADFADRTYGSGARVNLCDAAMFPAGEETRKAPGARAIRFDGNNPVPGKTE